MIQPPFTRSPLAPTDDAVRAAALLRALDRLVTAGGLYPRGHVQFAAAAAEYRRVALATAGRRAVGLQSEGGDLRLNGAAADPRAPGHERLLGLLERLGLAEVSIDPDASDDALHALATSLLTARREADESGHLRHEGFEDLPASVAVVPRRFRRRWSLDLDPDIADLLDLILDDVASSCVGAGTAEAARMAMEQIFQSLLADPRHAAVGLGSTDRDALIAALRRDPHAVSRALRHIITTEGSLAGLAALLDEADEALAAAGARQALQMLMAAMTGPDRAAGVEAPAPEARRVDTDDGYIMPLSDLRAALDAVAREAGPVGAPPTGDPCEDAAICLAVLSLDPAPGVAAQALAGLCNAAGRAQGPAQREFLHGLASSLLDGADAALRDRALPCLAEPFRRRGVGEAAGFWQALAGGDAGRALRVWPHVVVELLRTDPDEDPRGFLVLQTLATAPASAAMAAEAERFRHLAGFTAGTLRPAHFLRPRAVLHPIFAALMRTPLADTFGGWLHDGWQRQSADTAGGLAVRALGPWRRAHTDIYAAILGHGDGDGPPRLLLDAVHQRIDGLEADDRDQDWVPVALLVLGRWSPSASRRLLERIAGERRWGLLKTWPPACRAAAREALLRAPDTNGDDHGR